MAKDTREKENNKAAKREKAQRRKTQRSQIWQAFKIQKERDKFLIPAMALAFVLPIAVLGLLSLVWGWLILNLIVGVILGVMFAVIVFNRRLQGTVNKQMREQPGASGWVLENLRNGVGVKWHSELGVVSNAHLDVIHRVVGLPGVVLVGEGAAHRLKPLLAQERKKLSRVLGSMPIYDLIVGEGEGQVRVDKLQAHLLRLPRNIKKKDVDSLHKRVQSVFMKNNEIENMKKGLLAQSGRAPRQQSGMNRRMRRISERKKHS